ncbi:MAG: Hint domain-containing protein [Chryseolinea sp.]
MRIILFLLVAGVTVYGQDIPNPRPLRMEEYEKALTFSIKDLDEESYVKFENAYILDRYEMRKPYFVTGDDGLKKRIDLYKFIAKEGMQELGIVIFYTNEKNDVYKAVLPNFTAEGKVWEKYFEDIHAIDKVEKNFVLKLTYITSKELGYQIYKSLNQGKDLANESATYGNDICFPGDQTVAMSNGSSKLLAQLLKGDQVITIDPKTNKPEITTVERLIVHEAKNYALTQLTLIRVNENNNGQDIALSGRVLKATPNHPMKTALGEKKISEINTGEEVLCYNESNGQYEYFRVLDKAEIVQGVQKVYNIAGSSEDPFVMNGVMVLQK